MPNLSRREFEVYMLVVENAMAHQEIGKQLHIQPQTARIHLKNIYRKMQVRSSTELLVQYHKRERIV